MIKYVFCVSLALASSFACATIGSAQTVKVKGSDTLKPLAERWTQIYQKKNAGANVVVSGGGSASGIAALLKGESDIAEASRPLSDSEKDEFKKLGKNPLDVVVAWDAVEILVNPANPVNNLTMDQVKGIFTGTITNWKQVGGTEGKITVYGRESSSGTNAFLKEHALHNSPYAPGIVEFPGNAPMIAAVSRDMSGICYAGLASGKTLKHLLIKADASADRIEPSTQNVRSAKYPLSRQLHWFLAGHPAGHVKDLCLWVLSPEAQAITESEGFIPISAETRTSLAARL